MLSIVIINNMRIIYIVALLAVLLISIIVSGALLFGILNILGVKKAGFVQTVLASLLAVSVFTLFIAALCSPYAKIENMAPWWGFDKASAINAGAYTDEFANQSVI